MREVVINALSSWGYTVQWRILNTRTQGIPQNRSRFYLAAILTGALRRPFTFPTSIPAGSLEEFLDIGAARTQPCGSAAARAEALLGRMRNRRVDPSVVPCILDVMASRAFGNGMVRCSPCFTASRCAQCSHYISTEKGMMTLREMCRLQGLPPDRIPYQSVASKRTFGHAVGNAMSINVLMRVLPDLLYVFCGVCRLIAGSRV